LAGVTSNLLATWFTVCGVGLLYQQGYFAQYLNADGWQQERYATNDF